MKKNRLLSVVCVLLAVSLLAVSCGKKEPDTVTDASQTESTAEEAEQVAASTVEKIINKEDVIDIPESTETDTEDETEKQMTVNIFYVFGDYDGFEEDSTEISELTPEALISHLVLHNIVPVDTGVEEFSVVDTDDGKRELTLVLGDKFDAYIQTMSDDAENAIIASITDTFLEAYEADVIHFCGRDITWCDRPLDVLEEE